MNDVERQAYFNVLRLVSCSVYRDFTNDLPCNADCHLTIVEAHGCKEGGPVSTSKVPNFARHAADRLAGGSAHPPFPLNSKSLLPRKPC